MLHCCLPIRSATGGTSFDCIPVFRAEEDGSNLVSSRSAAGLEDGSLFYVLLPNADTSTVQRVIEETISLAPRGYILPGCKNAAEIQMLDVMISAQEALASVSLDNTRIIATLAPGFAPIHGREGQSPSRRLEAIGWDLLSLKSSQSNQASIADGRYQNPLELLRNQVALQSAALHLPALDTSSKQTGDGFDQECLEAKRQGFAGKFAMTDDQFQRAKVLFGSKISADAGA